MRAQSLASAVVAITLITISGVFARSLDAEGASGEKNAIPRTSGVLTSGGTPHPSLTEGTGLTCIVVGLASSYPQLYSDRLKQRIRFVYVDFKNSWNADSPAGVEKITLDALVDEVDQVRSGLGLDEACLVGHSAPGLVATEYTLRYPERVSHLILVSVEPYFTPDFRKKRTAYWETESPADRKAVLKRNVERSPMSC